MITRFNDLSEILFYIHCPLASLYDFSVLSILEMGLGPSKVTEQLYVGSLRDGTDAKKLEKAEITHIVTILSSLQYKTEEQKSTDQFTIPVRSSKFKRMRISIPDKSSSDLTPYFAETSQFIHSAIYKENGIVLVHCAEGVSRRLGFGI